MLPVLFFFSGLLWHSGSFVASYHKILALFLLVLFKKIMVI